ncbi:Smr/MutS family protein [Chloroflexota bacterium]
MCGKNSLKIYSGKSQAIRDYLQNHKLVKSFHSADKDHGGDGATDVEIIDIITD